ncbi:MAG: mandelate racemase/muconate lactonizing enzyme family protein [Halovenus sp.]
MSDIQIADVSVRRLSGPRDHLPGGGSGEISKLIVRVEADDGTYGLGEAEDFFGVVEAIQYVDNVLEGRDPMAIRPHVSEVVFGTLPPHTEQQQRRIADSPEGFRPIASTSPTATPYGPIVWGVAGVEMALCDLVGKTLGTPVYNLLGGQYRDEARIYLDRSAPEMKDDLDAWREMARESVAEEFDFLKFDIDYTAPDHTTDPWNRSLSSAQRSRIVERIGAVREEVGPDVELAVDCHWQYNEGDALRLARDLSEFDLMWFEDPAPVTDPGTYARVSRETDVPVCAGEMLTPAQFRQYLDMDACDIVHPDVLFTGGLHATHRIAELAEMHRVPMAMHGNGGCLATIAAAHVAAASRNFLGIEYHHVETDWLAEYVERKRAPLFENGAVPLTDAPGLGVELDRSVCEQYLEPGQTLF